ncbi:MAG: IS66 family transposase [Jatrophihabitantaceae bacterium]
MPGGQRVDELAAENAALRVENAELRRINAELIKRVEELERRLGSDSSNSSRPPSADAPWAKKQAKKRSSRGRSGRKPGKQAGAASRTRELVDDPDETVVIEPVECARCAAPLAGVGEHDRQRRQVVDIPPPPAPHVTEYRRISRRCRCCGAVTTPAWDTIGDDENAVVLAGPGSPVRIGPQVLARCALLACAHYLPVGRARDLVEALCGIDVSTGFVAGVRGRAAHRLENRFLPHLRGLLADAPVLHADETPARAAGSLAYVHVDCTEYLTLAHTGDRSAATIDAGGVLPAFTGVLVRDGYAGYQHLACAHAWCAAHLLRDLRSVSDPDPDGQLWALAMATCLLDANAAAVRAREAGRDQLTPAVLTGIRSAYHGALARGSDDNRDQDDPLAHRARTLIGRFRRYEDMILRFATDLTVPLTNNEAERSCRPVKIQQRTSGGAWRTLQGLTDFAVVHSYLDTATKWGHDKLDVLYQLFTTNGAWLPPALNPAS